MTLALKKDGTVWIWGHYGRVKTGLSLSTSTPMKIEGLTDVIQIAAGYDHFLVLKEDGTVWACGYNNYGQLGNGTTENSYITPVQVQNLSDVVQVAAAPYISFALKSDGTVWKWGDKVYKISTPKQVNGLTDIVKVCVGNETSNQPYYALKKDGTVWYWGTEFGGKGYYGPIYYSVGVTKMEQLENVIDISVGNNFVIAEKEDGSLWVWGHNTDGQLGNGTYDYSPMTPIPFTINEELAQDNSIPFIAKSITASGDMSAAIAEDGTVWTWGDTFDVDGKTNRTPLPTQIPGITDAKQVAVAPISPRHALILKSDGTVWAFGSNDNGQLGNRQSSNNIVQVENLTNVVQIAAARYMSMALKDDGTVWVWGEYPVNEKGRSWRTTSTPIQVEGLTDVVQIAIGYNHYLALKSDGTVWAWGDNDEGQLGNGTTTRSVTPIQVEGLTDVVQIAANDRCSLALKSDGTVWRWGDRILTPKQITGFTDIVKIAIGGGSYVSPTYYALKRDGTVWYWDTEYINDVHMVTKLTHMPTYNICDVVDISAGVDHVLALKKDGTVWAWGFNKYGQLGDGTNVSCDMFPLQVVKEKANCYY